MKKIIKIILLIASINLFINKVEAKSINVKFEKCVDGDTATFTYKNESIKARFLAIDTPETKHATKGEQPWGKEASEYTCKRLENAKKIVLEYDDKSDEKDMYNRHLVWVWLDDKLLQKDILNKGFAKIDYVYKKYKYIDELQKVEAKAKNKKVGIWSDEIKIVSNNKSNSTNSNNTIKDDNKYDSLLNKLIYTSDGKINILGLIIAIIIGIILFIFSKQFRNYIINKTNYKKQKKD